MTGDCAPLDVDISGRNGSNTSCVGDLVTYTCTVPAVAHDWEILSLGFTATINRNNPTFPRPTNPPSPFTIVTTADGNGSNPITTALSVTSFAGLRGEDIICTDGNLVSRETRNATAMVFGKC